MSKHFSHDCNDCVYLGSDENNDFYFCEGGVPTVIARFGNDGWEYYSGFAAAHLLWQQGVDHPLVRALELAKGKGLVE